MFAVQVIGVGNEYRGDDGAGPAVVSRLLERKLPPAVSACSHDGEAMSLLATWEGSDIVILIDALDCGAAPGTIFCLDAELELTGPSRHAGSTHALGVTEAILLARTLGRLPKTLIVFGIQGEQFTVGAELSPCVRRAIDGVVDRVVAVLDELRAQLGMSAQ